MKDKGVESGESTDITITDLKVGDFFTHPHKSGILQVTEMKKRFLDENTLIYYKTVLDKNGQKIADKMTVEDTDTGTYNSYLCKKITPNMLEEKRQREEKLHSATLQLLRGKEEMNDFNLSNIPLIPIPFPSISEKSMEYLKLYKQEQTILVVTESVCEIMEREEISRHQQTSTCKKN